MINYYNKVKTSKSKILKLKKTTKIFIVYIFILLFGIIGIKWYNEFYYNEYISNLKEFRQNITYNIEDSQNLIDLTVNVWIDSIEHNKNKKTFKYVWDLDTFQFLDYDEAIKKMQNDFEIEKTINDITSSMILSATLINDLKNPPNSLKDCYNVTYKLYESYVDFSYIVIYPDGSLAQYMDELERCSNNLLESFEEFEKQTEETLSK